MSQTVLFNRMPRIQEPLPQDRVTIPAPPADNPPPKFSVFQALMPLAGVFVMVAVYGGVRGDYALAIPMVATSVISLVTSLVGTVVQRRNQEERAREEEAAYAAVLKRKREELERSHLEQKRIRTDVDPDLDTLLARACARDPRLWERRPGDADFLSVRLGLGELPSTVAIEVPHPAMPDPRLKEAHAIENEYATVREVPVTASLRAGPLGVVGPLPERCGVARSLLCGLAVHHSPDEVHVLAVCSPLRADRWRWLRWLPHTYALGDVRLRYLSTEFSGEGVLEDLLEELHRRQNRLDAAGRGESAPAWPWLVVLVEDYEPARDDPAVHLLLSPHGRRLDVTALFMVDHVSQVPLGCSAIAELQADRQLVYSAAGPGGETFLCWPEHAGIDLCDRLARALAPVQVHALQPDSAMPSNVRLFDLLGIEDVDAYDVATHWHRRSPDRYLKVVIGERRGSQPMLLDLDHTGHGPHGLVAGTTGSGKSELLQTLVISLALAHHPYDVGFVLVDFKGGGAFSGLVDLPHTQGLVTDLGGNLAGRALVALEAEVDRRKRLFDEAGVSDVGPYQDLYWQGKVKEPLPRLVVIIDEFAELVDDYPDFIDGLIGIARVGRSLGVHLILATQSPAGVVKQQIWANAKFRICLRVESRQESQEMLHRPEAADLPRVPGRGYLQVGNDDVFELFQVARVAGRYRAGGEAGALAGGQGERILIARVSPGGERSVLFDSNRAREQRGARPAGATDLDVAVGRLAAAAAEMGIEKLPSPWPDPLPGHVALPDLLRRAGFGGWDGAGWAFERAAPALRGEVPPSPAARPPSLPNRPWLGALLGLLDEPARQRQVPLLLELGRQDGQLIAIGAPGSGKDMWARTLVVSLARTHTPDEVHFYLLEFGGQALGVLGGLPHVGGVFTPLDGERVQRLLRLLLDGLEKRKRLCGDAGVEGLVRLRELRPGQAPAAVVVVVTGFAEFRATFQDEVVQLVRLVREGGPCGIHVVMVGDRAGDVPVKISSVVARRVALRLADASDYGSVLGTRLRVDEAYRVPYGRGWYGRPPLEFQTASPGREEDETAQIAELQQIAGGMDRAWQGARPERVEVLPDRIPLRDVLARAPAPSVPPGRPRTAVPVGLDGVRMRPVLVDLVEDGSDFIVSGTPQGGKTTLLVTWVLALAEFNSPQQVQFVLVAGRRNSLGALRELPHVLDYCRTPEGFCGDGVLERLLAEIERREAALEREPSAAAELPHVVVVFDDYDEFCSVVGEGREVQDGLLTLARRGRDVEVHTVVAGPLPNMGVGYNDNLVKQLRVGRSGFVLRILDAADSNPLGLRVRPSELGRMPPGRGYLVRNGVGQMLQVAMPGDGAAVAAWVADLRRRWEGVGREM